MLSEYAPKSSDSYILYSGKHLHTIYNKITFSFTCFYEITNNDLLTFEFLFLLLIDFCPLLFLHLLRASKYCHYVKEKYISRTSSWVPELFVCWLFYSGILIYLLPVICSLLPCFLFGAKAKLTLKRLGEYEYKITKIIGCLSEICPKLCAKSKCQLYQLYHFT